MNNEKKLAVLRELTKLAIPTPTSGRSGQPIDTTNKPHVQANQDAVALNTMPAANRQITVKSPASKNTAMAGAMKTKGIPAAKPGKQNTAKFGTNMKTALASVDQKALLKHRLMERYLEKSAAFPILPFLYAGGKAALGAGARFAAQRAIPWIAKNIFRRGAQKAVQNVATNQARKTVAKKAVTEAERLRRVTTPSNTGKNFFQGVREGIKPGKDGKALRESAKAAREALKKTRQAADDVVGAPGKTPKLFRNPRVNNNKLPQRLKEQVIKNPKGNIRGTPNNQPLSQAVKKPGEHFSHKQIARGANPTRVSNPVRGQSPYQQTGNTVRYRPPQTQAGKDFAQKAYARSQRNIRIGELAAKAGRGVGTAGRYAGGAAATGVAGGALMGGGTAAYKYYDAATKANKPLSAMDGLKATASGAYEGTGIPYAAGLAGFMSKARKNAGNPFGATPTTDVSIKNTVANAPGRVNERRKKIFGGDFQRANESQSRVNPAAPVLYDDQFRPLSGDALKKARESLRKKDVKSIGERGRETFRQLGLDAMRRNQQNLNSAVQN